MDQPPGFTHLTLVSYTCRLYKYLYDLKQAHQAWYNHLSDYLLFLGFCASKVATSLFILYVDGDVVYLLVYVHDIFLIGSNRL